MTGGGLADGDPRQVGRWVLQERLGAGGMGTVFLGSDGDRLVAVKLIAPGLANDQSFRDRFRREVAVCRKVSGPQVAELLDADTDAAQPWLAVRYVPGPTLAEAVRSHGPLVGAPLRGFATAAIEALHQIHAAGVVHRDLKPSNIILTPTTPVIIDFGIAGSSDATSLTTTGVVMGSAGWMAPEQILGHPVEAPADVFAWATVVAFAATGRLPFGEGRPEALSYRVVHGEADLEGIDADLSRVLGPALARDPADRPTVAGLLDQLAGGHSSSAAATTIAAAWEDGAVTRIAPPATTLGVPPKASSPQRRRRLPTAVSLASVLLMVAFVAIVLVAQRKGSDAKDDASRDAGSTRTSLVDVRESTTTAAFTTSAAPTTTTPPTTTTVAPTTLPPLPPSVRTFDYLNRTYDMGCADSGDPITLVDGQWTDPSGDPSYGSISSVAVAYADVTGDATEDAIVTVGCGFGAGTEVGTTLVLSSTADGLTQVGQTIFGFGVPVSGAIVTETPYYADSDPTCCPSQLDRHTWKLRSGGWSDELFERVPADEASTWGE